MKTYREILEIDALVGKLYKENENLKSSKFGYWYNKFYEKNVDPIRNEYALALENIKVNNALEDEKTKALLKDSSIPNEYQYSKPGRLKYLEEKQKLDKEFYDKQIEVISFKSPLVPEGLTGEEREMLEGIII